MKTHLLKGILLVTWVLIGGNLLAQTPDSSIMKPGYVKPFSSTSAFRSWSVGVHVGVLTTNTIFGSNNMLDFTSPNAQIGFGGYIKNQILPSFGIQADFMAGQITADHSQLGPSGKAPYKNFNTTIHYSASLSADITLANINWRYNKSAIQPYLTVGVGTMSYTPLLTLANGTSKNFKQGNNGLINELFLPAGLGLKIDVAKGINLDLGYQVNFVYSDNVDGYKYGATNDKFSYAHIGLEFALGSRSKPQLATHNPVSSMREEYLSENQNTKDRLQAQIDSEKVKNEQFKKDLDATNATVAKLTADSDGDGVPDYFDKCPNTPAGTTVDAFGCPVPVIKPVIKADVTEGDRIIVRQAIKDLRFASGKATISEYSFPSLDIVAQLLINKNFNLKLAGYTDNVGSVALNLKLSQDRAEAVKSYLVSKGADASRIEATGYGKSSPIASNKTAKGRKLNRRVEFTLY